MAGATFRYVRPQENGNRMDTRWLALRPLKRDVPQPGGYEDATKAQGPRRSGGSLLVALKGSGGWLRADEDRPPAVPALSMQCHHFDMDDFDSVNLQSGGC